MPVPESSPTPGSTAATANPPADVKASPPIAVGSPANPASDEYYAILRVISEYGSRFLTIKGWSVTLSLAGLGLAFVEEKRWLLLLAAASALGFWIVEALAKQHQTRYFGRMRDIEVATYKASESTNPNCGSSPQIDWAWHTAGDKLHDNRRNAPTAPIAHGKFYLYTHPFVLPWVYLPHVLAVGAGILLFVFNPTNLA